jgi:hypothetical protein
MNKTSKFLDGECDVTTDYNNKGNYSWHLFNRWIRDDPTSVKARTALALFRVSFTTVVF